jgi:glycosyltransferase involved in cell wall biosynthesis
MRIVWVSAYWKSGVKVSPSAAGGLRVNQEILRRLQRSADVIEIQSSDLPSVADKHREVEVRYDSPLRFWYLVFELRLLFALVQLTLSFRPHWVFVSKFEGSPLRVALHARLFGKYRIATFFYHWSYGFSVKETYGKLRHELGRGRAGSILAAIEAHLGAWSLRFVDVVYCLTDFSKSQLKHLTAISDDRIVMTHGLGVDVDVIRSCPPQEAGLDAIMIGRISREKGVFDLIEIWEKVVRELPSAKVGVIGAKTNEFDQWISQLRTSQMEGNIRYLGTGLPQEDVYGLTKGAKLFVFPTHIEGWGIAFAEAICCGLPIVSYDISPLNTFGAEGIEFIPYLDKAEFAGRIIELLNDVGKRKGMSESNLNYAACFKTWQEITELVFAAMRERTPIPI